MNPAERLPVTQADAARSGSDLPHSQSGGPLLDTAALQASDADRFALAFRPSWAPLLQEPQPPAARAPAPPHKLHADREHRDEPLSVARVGRKTRRRGGLLASASVLSFVGLVYWGVSSTTEPAPAAQLATAPRTVQPIPPSSASDPATSPEADEAQPLAPASDLSALKARPQAPTDSPHEAQDPAPDPSAATPQPTEATETATSPVSSESGALVASAAEPAVNPASAEPTQAQLPSAPGAVVAAAPAQPSLPSVPSQSADVVPSPIAEPVAALRQPPAPTPGNVTATAVSQAPVAPAQPSHSVAAADAPAKPAAPLAAQPSAIATAQSARAPAPEVAPQHKRLPLLSVRALPEGARLFLDGQRLPNPFDMRLPEGGKHKLEARYEGFETSSQTVRIESDAKLTITLRRVGPTPEPQLQVRPLNQPQHTRGAGFVTSNPY